MTDTPEISMTRANGRRRKLVWAAVFFFVAFVLPTAGLWHLTYRFDATAEAAREAECREKARELLMRLRSSLDRNAVITDVLARFRRNVITERHGRRLDAESASLHEASLRKHFPADTRVIWFDANGRVLLLPGKSAPLGQRAWQVFLRALRDDPSLSTAEQSLANGIIKKTFGNIATFKYLQRCRKQALEVLIAGKIHSIAVMTFNSKQHVKQHLGSCLFITPLFRARHGWELERATRLLTTSETAVGGIWQTTGDGPAAEPLSPGMLHGLWERLQKGESIYSTAEWYMQSQIYDRNTDLMLTVAIRTAENSRMAESLTKVSRIGLAGCVLTAGFALLALVAGWWHPRTCLEAKFKIAALALTLPPLFAMMLLGLEHLNRLSQRQSEGLLKSLEGNLSGIEQRIASELGRLDMDLQAMAKNPALATTDSTEAFTELMAPFRSMGLTRAILTHRDGRTFQYNSPRNTASWVVLDAIAKRTMQFYGFRLPKLATDRPVPLEFEALFPLKMVNDNSRSMFNTLTPLQFANHAMGLFQSFLKPANGAKPFAYFSTHFDHASLYSSIMERALRETRSLGAKVAVIGNLPATPFFKGRNAELRKLLDLVRFTGQRVQTTIKRRGRTWLVLARPMKGIDAAGVAIIPSDSTGSSWPATAMILALFAFGGAAGSMWAISRLRSLLIEPLIALSATVTRVESGDYKTRLVSTASDELGVLIRRLAILVQGLRHKARMTPFLRTDLVETAASQATNAGCRQLLTVWFAGLRDFSGIESQLQPEEAMKLMSRYLGLCETAVKRNGGEIDKFIGDTAMAVFRETPDAGSSGLRAARAALDLETEMSAWMNELINAGQEPFQHGVGFACGSPVAGHIGSLRKRLDATVIGDTVNLAARLEKLAGRGANPSILTTAETIEELQGEITPVPTSIHGVRGRQEAIEVFGIRRAGNG